MDVKILKDPDDPTYIVKIGSSFYEMSGDANMPNGVNMYIGDCILHDRREILLGDVPKGMLVAIIRRILTQVEGVVLNIQDNCDDELEFSAGEIRDIISVLA